MNNTELAVTVLQSILRGTATNTQMSNGLLLNAGTMIELRTTNPLWEESKMIARLKEQQHRLAEQQRHELLFNVRHTLICTVVFEAEASGGGEVRQVVSPTLPFPLSLPSPFPFPLHPFLNQWEGRSDPVRGKFPGFPPTNTTLHC